MNFRLLRAIFAVASLGVCAHAYASGAVEAVVAPISLGAPTATYPSAFSGLGIGLQADYFFNNTPWGLSLGFLSQGNGKYESINFRYYMIGHPQLSAPANLESIKVESRSRGLYFEAGFAAYQVSSTPVALSPTSSQQVQTTVSGIGAVGGIALEQPFFWGMFLGLKADLLSSAGSSSPFSVIIIAATVGIPISF